jgi:hypothetical protein
VFPLTTIYCYFPSMIHMLGFFLPTHMDTISPRKTESLLKVALKTIILTINTIYIDDLSYNIYMITNEFYYNLIHTCGALYYIYPCVKYTSCWFSLGTRFSN